MTKRILLPLLFFFSLTCTANNLKAAPDTLIAGITNSIDSNSENETAIISTTEKIKKKEVQGVKKRCERIKPIQYISAGLLLALIVLSVILM